MRSLARYNLFVAWTDPRVAAVAMRNMNGKAFGGPTMVVRYCESKRSGLYSDADVRTTGILQGTSEVRRFKRGETIKSDSRQHISGY